MRQLYTLIGSADVLGNPAGLARHIRTSVRDFVLSPIERLEQEGAKSLPASVSAVTGELFARVGYSVLDATGRIVNSFSRGLTEASLDDRYEKSKVLYKVLYIV